MKFHRFRITNRFLLGIAKSRFSGIFVLLFFVGIGLVIMSVFGGKDGGIGGSVKRPQNYSVANTTLEPFFVDDSDSTDTNSANNSTSNTTTNLVNNDVTAAGEESEDVLGTSALGCLSMCDNAGTTNVNVSITPFCQGKAEDTASVDQASELADQGGIVVPRYTTDVRILDMTWNFAAMRTNRYVKIPQVGVNGACDIYDAGEPNRLQGLYTSDMNQAKVIQDRVNGMDRTLNRVVLQIKAGSAGDKEDVQVNVTDALSKAPGCLGESSYFQSSGPNLLISSTMADGVGFTYSPLESPERDENIPNCIDMPNKPIIIKPSEDAPRIQVGEAPNLLTTIEGLGRQLDVANKCQRGCGSNPRGCAKADCGVTTEIVPEDLKGCVDDAAKEYQGLNCDDKRIAGFVIVDQGGSIYSCDDKQKSNCVIEDQIDATRSPYEVVNDNDGRMAYIAGKCKVSFSGDAFSVQDVPCYQQISAHTIQQYLLAANGLGPEEQMDPQLYMACVEKYFKENGNEYLLDKICAGK